MSNTAAIERGMAQFGRKMNLVAVMESIADEVLVYIATTKDIPVDTGNLKDSTGVGIYFGDTLLKYVPNPIAKKPRRNLGMVGYEKGDVWGADVIQDALDAGRKRYALGYHLVLFSAMPYAKYVERQKPYFGTLKNSLDEVINGITAKYGNIIHIEDTR